jgi:hypothetical protein
VSGLAAPHEMPQKGTPPGQRPFRTVRNAVVTRKAGRSGESRFALAGSHEQAVTGFGREHVVRFLKPGELGLQVANPPLEAAHFRSYAGIRPADVAE